MYIGRFAPSPTGPLHLGSLLTALASYLDAKHHNGQWLIRIEDLDPPREIPGASDSIIAALERFGMFSDTPIIKQSDRHSAYEQQLEQLAKKGLTYPCRCARKDLLPYHGIHPHNSCPSKQQPDRLQPNSNLPTSIRLRVPKTKITVQDLCQPTFITDIQQEAGDFILKRKDQLFAYHLAVTIDDHWQSITHIVRGADLLSTTPQHLYLQSLLGFQHPSYLHIPVITHPDGSKLSKQTFAASMEEAPVEPTLLQLLDILGQHPPSRLAQKTKEQILAWGTAHWSRENIPARTTLSVLDIPQPPHPPHSKANK